MDRETGQHERSYPIWHYRFELHATTPDVRYTHVQQVAGCQLVYVDWR